MKIKTVRREQDFTYRLYLPAIFAGMKLTISHFFRNLLRPSNKVTIQYPEETRKIADRWRGRHRLLRRDDGFLRCVACYMCETVCPANCIHIESGEHPDKSIEKYPVVFDIDELRCVFCGLCVEACPKDAIRMDTKIVSLAYVDRQSFDFTRNLLLDSYSENKNTKYTSIPLPGSIDEALPKSTGVLPPRATQSIQASA